MEMCLGENKPYDTGIYGIFCLKDNGGTVYVGSTQKSFLSRYKRHVWDLEANRHDNPKLQNAWNKYGPSGFVFRVLEVVAPGTVICRKEQWWLDHFVQAGEVYNLALVVENPMFGPRAEELKKRIGDKNRNRVVSKETREKMSASHMGRKRVWSKAHKIAHTKAMNEFKHNSVSLERISRANRGEGHPLSKLRDSDVLEIRQLSMNGYTQSDIAATYNVHPATISKIVNRKRWRHL